MNTQRKIIKASGISILLFLVILTSACRGAMVKEQLRINNSSSMKVSQLGFKKGSTTLPDAKDEMHRQGMTGVVVDIYAPAPDSTISVLTADYQRKIHIFENFRYRMSIDLHSGIVRPYGFAVRVASIDDRKILMVLYRDPLGVVSDSRHVRSSTIEMYEIKSHAVEYLGDHSLETIEKNNNGIYLPVFIGYDLSSGIMLMARDSEGLTWNNIYFMRMQNKRLSMEPVPLNAASQCSRVRDYVNGDVLTFYSGL